MKNVIRTAIVLVLLHLAGSAILAGQAITGGIIGTVTDITGRVVPGAEVTITNQATGISTKQTTNHSGDYTVDQLPVGGYSVTVSAPGFATASTSGIAVNIGSQVRVDLKLPVGPISQTVEVQSDNEALQTTGSQVSNTIGEKMIDALPVASRDPLTLTLLSPTVVQRGTSNVSAVDEPYLGTNIPTIAGGRGEAVNFTVGGLNINNRLFNTPMEKPPLDSLAEVTVLTDNYSAEYGLGDGQIIMEIRSGTNSIHGTAYEYVENTDLNARNYLDPARNIVHQNQFGATLGGPVVLPHYNGRNHTFFFFNYEGTRIPNKNQAAGLYPTAAMLAGNFSGLTTATGAPVPIYDPATTDPTGVRQLFPGNVIPTSRISPIALKLLAAYDTPTASNFSNPTDFSSTIASNTTVDQYAVKFDSSYGPNTFSTRYSLSNPYLFSGNLALNAVNTNSLRNQLIGQTWTRTFGPRLLNDFRVGYTRQLNNNVPPIAASSNLQDTAGITNPLPYNLLPYIPLQSSTNTPTFSSLPTILAGGNGQLQQQLQLVDEFSWTKGNHAMKFGVDFRRRHMDSTGVSAAGQATIEFNGEFSSQLTDNPSAPNALPGGFVATQGTGSPLADFLLGQISEEDYGLGNDSYHFRDNMYSFFAQDLWRLNRRLTVSYGVRWDYQSPVAEKNGRESWLVKDGCPTSGGCLVTDGQVKGLPYDPIVNPFPGVDKIRNGGLNPDRNNFGPRLGVTYLLNPSTVVRFGGGVFYSLVEQYQLSGLTTQPPFGTGYQIRQTTSVLQNSTFQLGELWTPLATTTSGTVAPGTVSLNQIPLITNATPALYDANLAIQHQFSPNTVAEIAYAGKFGRKLSNFEQINYCAAPVNSPCQQDPVTGQDIRVYSNFGPIYAQTTDATNEYEAVYADFEKKLHHGFSVVANYTFSRDNSAGLDSVSNDIFQGGTDIFSLEDPRLRNKKRSLLDVPQRFVVYGVYNLPFGHGSHFGNATAPFVNALISGWQISGIETLQSGQTLDLSSYGAAYFVAGKQNSLRRMDFKKTGYFFDPTIFTLSADAYPVPANNFYGAGINNTDMSLFKKFAIRDQGAVELRSDFYNLFNHGQFELPENVIFDSGFGKFLPSLPSNSGNSARPARVIQLSARLRF